MFGVAAIGALVQWLVTRTVIRSEHERLRIQLQSEFHLRQFEQWQSRLQEIIADLLKETDPEVSQGLDRDRIVPLILRAQLMLNLKEPNHRNVNDLINQLGLAVNG